MIELGTRVRVIIPSQREKSKTLQMLANKYNGKVMEVTRYKLFRDEKDRVVAAYCELKGATSAAGIPYAFDIKWLIEHEETEDEK